MAETIITDVEVTEEDLMLQAASLLAAKRKEPNELTSRILADAAGISIRVALTKLQELEQDGILVSRKIIESGHTMNAYVPAIEGGWEAVMKVFEERWGV